MLFWNRTAITALLVAGVLLPLGCSGAVEREKKQLTQHGTIDAEWEVRDEANHKTLTYLMLQTPSGLHETYELAVADGENSVLREQVGGIDGTGCYLLPSGAATAWILGKGAETLEGTTQSGDKTRTRCLEYKESDAWRFIPAKDRKAAEPPPEPPKVAPPAPDAGTTEPDAGGVKSAMPL